MRALLMQEIKRKEDELASLRHSLSVLEEAIKMVASAYATSKAVQERNLAAQALALAEQLEREAASKAQEAASLASRAIPEPVVEEPFVPVRVEVPPVVQQPVAVTEPPTPSPAPVAPPVAHRTSPAHHGKYSNLKIWKAIQNLITENQGAMTIDEIVQALQQGGAHLGESPTRTVTAAISYMNDKIFHVSKSGNRTLISVLRPSEF